MISRHLLLRQILAILLITVFMLPGSGPASFAAPAYTDHLDGWKVDCTWSDYSYDMELYSTGDKVYRPELIFSYRLENAERDYAPGSIHVTIPGIGKSYRKDVAQAYRLPTDSAESEWDVSWDQSSDVYTFTNRFEVKEGQSVNGGFEVIWELSGRDIINGYTQKRSPGFSVEGAGSITLKPLSFSCTSQRDRYRLCLNRESLDSAMNDAADTGHVWYGFKATFEKDWLSRGLSLSDCIITVETSKSIDPDDIVIKDVNGKALKRNIDSGGEASFWLFEKRTGDLGNRRNVLSLDFMVGLPRGSMDGEELTVRVHLDRLYNDEDEWVREAGKGEAVDQEITLMVEDYGFTWNGLRYSTDIWNELYENYHKAPHYYTHEYEDELTHLEPPVYSDRLCAPNIYDGTVVEFTLRGSSEKDYSPANAALLRATPSNAGNDDTFTDIRNPDKPLKEDKHVSLKEYKKESLKKDELKLFREDEEEPLEEDDAEYEEIIILPFSLATPSDAQIALTSNIAEGEEYSMVLGDDVLAIYLRDGSIRALEDDEYDFAYIRVPNNRKGYSYELYGSDRKDAPFEEYDLLAVSDMSAARKFSLPDGIKAVYVKIDGITEDFAAEINVGVSFHLDRQKEQTKDEESRPDHENRIVNFSYFRALCLNEQNAIYNDCKMTESDYTGSFGELLARHDMESYGEWLLRDYSNVWLRSTALNLKASASVSPFKQGEDVSTAVIKAEGTLKSDSEGTLRRFSIYTVLPDGINTDFYSEPITVTGDLTTENGGKVAYPEDYVSFSQGTYMGQKMIIADFDFSRLPLMADASNEVSISYPVSLSRADQAMYGDSYIVTVYLLPHDEDIDKVTGPYITEDVYDIDQNGNTTEKMASAGIKAEIDREADEWREYAAKYVKSAFSGGYVKDAVTTRYAASDDDPVNIPSNGGSENTDPFYEYRLDLGLGASAAENIIFFDHLEQGAKIAVNESDASYEILPGEWQGSFISVDTSYAERLGFKITVYYSTNTDEAFDLSSPGWQKVCPHDASKVRSIAVSLDTSDLPGQVMQPGSFVYVIVKMRALEDEKFIGKTAVNQYTACYDSYGTNGAPEGTFTLPSAATTLRLLEGVGRIVLQKVDADDIIRVDADGNPHYAPLTGGTFQIYDASEDPLFDKPQALNSMGMIVVSDIPTGKYYWEEMSAPEGYERIPGRHEFTVDGTYQVITVENHRLPDKKAEAVLTIDKKVNDIYAPFGDPTFIFKITRSDGTVYYTSITLRSGIYEGSVSLKLEQGYTYIVEEVGVSRYLPDKVEPVKNVEADLKNHTAVADPLRNDEAEVKFYNTEEQYEKFSHSAAVVNRVGISTE